MNLIFFYEEIVMNLNENVSISGKQFLSFWEKPYLYHLRRILEKQNHYSYKAKAKSLLFLM